MASLGTRLLLRGALRTRTRNSIRKPALGRGAPVWDRNISRALGAPGEQFGPELGRLRTRKQRAVRVGDWVVQEVDPTPKAEEFVREFFFADVLPRLHHVNPRNWLKPKTLLLDTVLAGARKCREEPELRDWFAQLLASAMDPKASALVHPSFASIIAEMAPIDAVVLEFIWQKSGALNTTGGVPSLQVVWITHPGSHFINKYRNFIGRPPELEGLDVDTMQISISNLERLGIVETQTNLLLGNSEMYKLLTESELSRKLADDAQKEAILQNSPPNTCSHAARISPMRAVHRTIPQSP